MVRPVMISIPQAISERIANRQSLIVRKVLEVLQRRKNFWLRTQLEPSCQGLKGSNGNLIEAAFIK